MPRIQITIFCSIFLFACSLLANQLFAQEKERIRLPIPLNGVYEGELHFKRTQSARPQGMRNFGTGWSNDAHLLWDGKPQEICEVKFYVRNASKYHLQMQLTKAPDYGRFEVLLNDKVILPDVDLYSQKVELASKIDLGTIELSGAIHRLSFKLIGSNEKAVRFRKDRFLLGFDYLKLTNLNPKPDASIAEIRARKKAHLSDAGFRSFLVTNCLACHNATKSEGKIDLSKFKKSNDFRSDLKLLQNLAEVIRQEEMPPEDARQPDDKQRNQAALWLENQVDDQLLRATNLPLVVMRRLNRYEYNNAVRDLLNLRGDIYPLPEKVIRSDTSFFEPTTGYFPDQVRVGNRALGKFQIERQVLSGVVPFAMDLQAEHGFNNQGRELSISPLLLESFLKLGESIVDSSQFKDYCRDYPKVFEVKSDASEAEVLRQARERISKLLERGFRQPVHESVLNRYTRFFEQEYARTQSFSQSMKKIVSAVLASPYFLFIHHRPGGKEKERLDDYELATRLSFFLWNSIPDDTLLSLAKEGKLSNSEVLETQIHNMLLDRKSEALAQNFARQWLRLDQLITAVPDPNRFAEYYSRIGCEYWKFGLQMMLEPLLLFESVMVDDESILKLIDSDYSYRSDELQSWYNNAKPFENRQIVNRFNTNQQYFTRRKLDSRRQGGVITTAAVMTMTSSPLRTSPIIRGSWFATVILNQPPPPPPDIVPEIEADDADFERRGLTLRERLKQHQENQSCVSCHAKIDPFGFALENFDAVGRWRDHYRSGLEIDTKGKLFGKHEFKNIETLKEVLVKHPEIFVRAFSEHLLSYALGRELEVTDKPAIDKIVRNVLADNGRFSRVILEVATSYPFLHRTGSKNTGRTK